MKVVTSHELFNTKSICNSKFESKNHRNLCSNHICTYISISMLTFVITLKIFTRSIPI